MWRPIVLAASATAALSACGGDGNGDSGPAVTVQRGQAIRVTAREYRFSPDRIVVVGERGRIRLKLTNEGSLAHDLRLFRGDRDLGGTPPFQGGSRAATVDLPPGDYKMICTVGDHADLGMTGSLRVRARN